MKTVLTDTQISYLFAFCKKHYVHYYDVQVELVDHLANAIEEKMTINANESFEKILDEVYKNFGYKGFAGIIEAKTIALNNEYGKLRWKLFFEYFTLPKVSFTAFMVLLLIFLKSVIATKYTFFLVGFLAFCFVVFELILARKISKKSSKPKQRLLLLEAGQQQFFFTFIGIQVMAHFIATPDIDVVNWYQYVLFSCIMVLLILFSLAYYNLCKYLYKKAVKDYPIAFL